MKAFQLTAWQKPQAMRGGVLDVRAVIYPYG